MQKATIFEIEEQPIDITSRAGIGFVGLILERSNLRKALSKVKLDDRPRPEIPHYDIVSSLIALCAEGDPHFDSIEKKREEKLFGKALGLKKVPSAPTVRQRCEQGAEAFQPIVARESVEILHLFGIPLTPVETPADGPMVPLDIDWMEQDNSGTKKEGVCRTYKGTDGYGISAAYAGEEGYQVHHRLQTGNHHANWEHGVFLRKAIHNTRLAGASLPILVRMDSGNDAQENVDICREENALYLIKHNFRREDPQPWIHRTRRKGRLIEDNKYRRVWVWSQWRQDAEGHRERWVYRVTQPLYDAEKRCRLILMDEYEIDAWRTCLGGAEKDVIEMYKDHGTSEQYHSEYKTDLNMERLPSHSFATNALMVSIGMCAYNVLRMIGQVSLRFDTRRPTERWERRVTRRRLRTVIADLIHVGARVVRHARRWKLVLSRWEWQSSTWKRLYHWFSSPWPIWSAALLD